MRLAAVVILYQPDESVIENILTYYPYVEKLIIFDNTESAPYINERLSNLSKAEYYHNYNNEGIAKRLNEAALIAIREEFDWLLTMDQDSSFSSDAIKNYLNCFNAYPNKETVAMFGVAYGRLNESSSVNCSSTTTDGLITSGTLVNLKAYNKIGRFDEDLFIDAVDHDYSIKAKMHNFSIIQFSNIYLNHKLGTEVYRSSVKSLFLLKKKKRIHHPIRCYYMYRNLLFLEKKYKDENTDLMKSVRETVYSNIVNCIFYGRSTLKIFRYLIMAHKDYKRGKMGKFTSVQ